MSDSYCSSSTSYCTDSGISSDVSHSSGEGEGATLDSGKTSRCNYNHTNFSVTRTANPARWWESTIIYNNDDLTSESKMSYVDRFFHVEAELNSANTTTVTEGEHVANALLTTLPASLRSFAFPFNVIVPFVKDDQSRYGVDKLHALSDLCHTIMGTQTSAPNTTVINDEQSQYAFVDHLQVSDSPPTDSETKTRPQGTIVTNDNMNDLLGMKMFAQGTERDRTLASTLPAPLPLNPAIGARGTVAPEVGDAVRGDDYWEVMYQRLCEYQKTYGSCLVPRRFVRDEELGSWVKRQRTLRKMGNLHHSQEEKLNKIGFSWCPQFRKHHRTIWNQMFEELAEYQEAYGNCLVPTDYEDKPKLLAWIQSQRNAWSHGLMTEMRERKLNGIGFEWEDPDPNVSKQVSYEQIWMNMFDQLLTYRAQHGNCLVPSAYAENPKLAAWVFMQRTAFEKKKLTEERIQKLNEVGFAWTVIHRSPHRKRKEGLWRKRFGQLVDFFKHHGHCVVPNPYANDRALGIWVASQRRAKKLGNLSAERERCLSALGFQWRVPLLSSDDAPDQSRERQYGKYLEDLWDELFQQLVDYKNKYGDCLVPYDYMENSKLVYWVRKQRVMKKAGRLREDREQRLLSIGFVWVTRKRDQVKHLPNDEALQNLSR